MLTVKKSRLRLLMAAGLPSLLKVEEEAAEVMVTDEGVAVDMGSEVETG